MWGAVGFVLVDRVRQSGESDAGSRDRQVPRDFRPHRARRRAVADHPATAHRERDALGPGRRFRLVDRQMGRARLRSSRSVPGKSSWLILDYTMDYRVLGYLIAISIGTGLLFGLAPALRLSKLDVNATLKDGGRGATGGGRGKHLSALLVTGRNGAGHSAAGGSGGDDPQLSEYLHRGPGRQNGQHPYDWALICRQPSIPMRRRRFPSSIVSKHVWKHPGRGIRGHRRRSSDGGSAPRSRMSLPALHACRMTSGRPTLSALIIGPDYFRTLGAAVLSGREFNDATALREFRWRS